MSTIKLDRDKGILMTATLYGLKNCDTCKRAMKALEGAGQSVTFVDIRADADLPSLVPDWLGAVGADRLINRRSTTWRTLSDSDREADPLRLLIDNPTLIKRPVIVQGGAIHVGWSKDVEAALI